MTARPVLLAAAAGLALAAPVSAQWLTFTDETATRLSLTTVPTNDTMEKDIAFHDFDKDGWTDAVVARKIPFSNSGKRQAVLLMNIGGVLTDKSETLAPSFMTKHMDAREVVYGDFDGDTWQDLVFGSTFGDYPSYYRNLGRDAQGNWLGFAEESSRFPKPELVPQQALKVCACWPGDIDNDGDLDMYFSNYGGGDEFLMVNDGTGHFTDETAERLGEYANVGFGTAVEFHDLDHDGDQDVIKCSTLGGAPPFGSGIFIMYNDGAGKFNALPFQDLPNTASPYFFKAADLNNDEMMDFYVVQDGQDTVRMMTGFKQHSVTFSTKSIASSRTGGLGGNTSAVDVDKDGDLDIGVGPIDVDIPNCGSGSFALFRNDGQGNLSDPYGSNQNFHQSAHDTAMFDINGDGCVDLFQGLCTGWRVFIQNDCAPPPCYADCDADGVLSIDDFVCFQTYFALSDDDADCDESGSLTIDDFVCFQSLFAAGCP